MRLSLSYKQLDKLLEQETLEPVFSWGMRMAIAATAPIVWGVATGHIEEAIWISLTAEGISWVELKGSFGQGARVLLGGIVLAVLFTFFGSITGPYIWLSVVCMLGVGFLSGLFKNLGDRGAGLATCVYVLFILTNAYPTHSTDELLKRMWLVFIGGAWNAAVGIFILSFMPAREPYRRTIALIWKAISELTAAVSQGWDGNGTRNNIRELYLKEKGIRTAIDNSFHFYGNMAHQVSKTDRDYPLAQLRKATALVAAHIIAISEELETIAIRDLNEEVRLKLYAVFKALQQTTERMAVFVVTLKPEEELLLSSRLARLNKLTGLLREDVLPEKCKEEIQRVIQLTERTIRLIESSVGRLEEMGDDQAVFRSYSLIKTLLVLHPKHWIRNLQLLFNFNTFTARYALRSSIGATLALFLAKWFKVDHGYWLPFTVLLVMQPYFGATIKKALDRMAGTITGGIVGGLLLRIPTGLYLREFILFISFVLMVYFLRTRYSVAAFFITISLVLLFNFEGTIHDSLIVTRALSTAGGAALAIIAGFALLPYWDKKWLPLHLANAISCNYQYFLATFFTTDGHNAGWTRNKRNAESKNSNAFDSFNRYMQEPLFNKKYYSLYYHLITHNVRVTRELNNINLEQDSRATISKQPTAIQQELINNGLLWFNKNILLVQRIDPDNKTKIKLPSASFVYPFGLTMAQAAYLEKMTIELKAMNNDLQQLAGNPNMDQLQ